jgi:hypothetical protein
MERLDAVRAPFLGVVLNSVNLDNPEYAYYRYYYGSDYADVGQAENSAGSVAVAPHREELYEDDLGFEKLGPGTVPQDFFDRMIAELSEAAGPMAPLIVRDHIALLGESRSAFPKRRLKELLDRVSKEIFDERIRGDFRRRIGRNLSAL